jgi:integrase-like protein
MSWRLMPQIWHITLPMGISCQVENTRAREDNIGVLRKLSKLRFLTQISHGDDILLPAPELARNAATITPIFPGFIRRYLTRRLAHRRLDEVICGVTHLDKAHNGARQLRTVDFLILFCSGNYGSSSEFSPEFLALTQAATAGFKNNIRPYFQGIRDFHQLSADDFRRWDAKLKGRNSVSVNGGIFALFQEPSDLVRVAQPVQVSNYEKKTGLKFPQSFDQGIIEWTHTLEEYVRKLPRTNAHEAFESAKLWVTYLTTLPAKHRPRNFAEIDRYRHIISDNEQDKTFAAFLDSNELERRARLRDLHQILKLWQSEQKTRVHLPIIPEIDWTNRPKFFRTKRKAIPTLIVETLIEENARECESGHPYALYREWIEHRGSGGSIHYLDGERADAKLPSVPAVIDCILHLGMRSSSARWLDSGQADEFEVNIETVSEVLNSSSHATVGVRNGFLQRMQVGPKQWVTSFLMLRNKTVPVHEIPYAPEDLIKRLLWIAKRQKTFNSLAAPVRAVEDEKTTNNIEEVPLVFPLFRDPSNADSKPVSYSKVTTWWNELLKKCEPIVNSKREAYYGEDSDYYDFFDSSSKPIWDIHSIRVTVITSLLEMGVSPTIVQHLVGHRSFVMTLHYESVDSGKINSTISQALEARRVSAANAIASARNEEELDAAIENVMGGFASSDSSESIKPATSYAFANGRNLRSSPGAFSVFSHGICPGGDCRQGGEKRGNTHLPVHRDKACSRCRFRITGPAFVAGLEMNANILMNEISDSTRKEAQLNVELLELNRTGKPCAVLESRLQQEREYRDEVWADWAAEYNTIKRCLGLAREKKNQDSLPALPADISVHFSEKGQLSLLQDIIGKSKMISAASFDIPSGLEEVRNEMLWDIAIRSGDVAKYLISLTKTERNIALDLPRDFSSTVD